MNLNMEMAIANGLDVKDITVISLLDLISNEKGSDVFEYSFTEIIKSLPIVFDGISIEANSVRLRRILDKEGMQKFVTRKSTHKGRGLGIIVTFNLNRKNIDLLNVKGLIN